MSSHIRFLHGIPGRDAVDVYLGQQRMSRGLEYEEITPHMLVPSGRNRLRVSVPGEDRPVLQNGIIIPEGTVYTLFMGNNGTEDQLYPVEEPRLQVSEGSGALRMANFSDPEGEWDVWIRREDGCPEKLFENLEFGEVTEYVILEEGEYSLEIRDDDDRIAAAVLGVTVQPGRFYTIYLVGRGAAEEESFPLVAIVAEDVHFSGDQRIESNREM